MTERASAAPTAGKSAPGQQRTTSGAEASAMTDVVDQQAGGPLVTAQGRTTVADSVVAKIAGIATREIPGVHDLGGGAARAVGSLRGRIAGSRTNLAQGVSVEVGERQAAIDVDIVAEYGVAILDLATGIRSNVIAAVERMTGLEVAEVNVTVNDVHLESEEPEPEERRVE